MQAMKRIAIGVITFIAVAVHASDGALQFASLGDFSLDNGQTIRACRIGYRTYGQLAPDKSNVLVVPTWFAGTTAGLAPWIGPAKLYDSAKYFVVAIDALGDGVSSSPSNSTAQPGTQFPQFTIRDMVRSQYELLTRELKLDHVYAVSGLSMGGMQTLQWVVSYPQFMTKAIPIVGTPKQTAADLLLWKTELSLIASPAEMKAAADINAMHLHTAAWLAEHVPDVDALMKTQEDSFRKLDPNDYASQLRAMIGQDIGLPSSIRARMLVVVSLQDQMVNPAPARELARVTQSELLTLTSDCGHLAPSCEQDVLARETARFLSEP